jgi:HD-like signal output (HDOD) protein
MPKNMHDLFEKIHKVPQIPDVVKELINQLNNPDSDVRAIAKNIEKEQVIALKVLRLVNSAHFGLTRKVTSIDEATLMVGKATLKTLVIASGIVGSIPAIENFNIKQFWTNSFNTATSAKWFAGQAGLNVDIAYTAGLLSNLGNILIHLGAPREANEIDQHVRHGQLRAEMEKNRLGYTSQQVCAELCRRWKLSDELVKTIELSENPLAEQPFFALAGTVFLGQYISNALDKNHTTEDILAQFPKQVSSQLALTEEFINEKINEIVNITSEVEGII